MAVFLTQAWFDQVQQLTENAGELNLSPTLKNLKINLKIHNAPNGDMEASFYDGNIHQNFIDNATTTVSLDAQILRAILLEKNINQAMEAFMSGKIRIEGDMGQLLSLQTVNLSQEQKQLFKNIVQMTDK